jgi:hypothetical protein
MAKKDTTLYIGQKEVKGLKDNVVTFADETEKTYTEKQLKYLITNEPKDLTQLQELLIKAIVPEIMDTLEEHDIMKWDFSAVMAAVASSYNETFYKAIWKAFGTYEEGIHHEYYSENIRVSDIKKQLSK